MKLALLATLLTFGGSIAGFGIATGGSPAPVAASPPSAETEHLVVRGQDRDCPKAEVDRT